MIGRVCFVLLGFILGAMTAPAVEVTADNDDGAPAYIEGGIWTTSASTGYNGGTYRYVHSSAPPSSATWSVSVPHTGFYEVRAILVTNYNRPVSAPYTIVHASGSTVVTVDQSSASARIQELLLGRFFFHDSTIATVRLDNTGSEGYYIADAVRWRTPTLIESLESTPGLPSSTQPVTITARIISSDPAGSIAGATLVYSASPSGNVGALPMLDDGSHGDGVAGDDVFGAAIPPLPHRDQVDYHVTAADNTGLEATATGSYRVGALQEEAYTFILAGQSNASGRGALDGNNEASDPRVLLFGNDYQWRIAYEPVDDPAGQLDSVSDDSNVITESKGHSFALRAAKELLGSGTRMIRVIPCPKGGTSISLWRRGADPLDRGTLFGSCNYRRLIAAPGGAPTALWWYQGESDSGNPSAFAANHTALISEFREEVGGSLPVVYVQLAKHTNPVNSTNLHNIGELQRQLESLSGNTMALSDHHMVVAFDLPMTDAIHIDQAAQKELGRRVGLATRQHILGEQVDGTGPRLLADKPLIHPGGDRSRILVRFNGSINDTTNSYEGQFRVFDDTTEVPPTSVHRAPSDASAVLIILPSAVSATASVSYGDIPAAGLGISLPGVIKGVNDLPAPRFGPLEVEIEASRVNFWRGY